MSPFSLTKGAGVPRPPFAAFAEPITLWHGREG